MRGSVSATGFMRRTASLKRPNEVGLRRTNAPQIGLIANPPGSRQEFSQGAAANRGRSQPSPSGPLVLTNLTHRLLARGVVVIERQGRSARTLRLFGSCSGSWSSQHGATRAIIIPSAPGARYATESGVSGSYA
jgi:hypothetical protein